MRIVYLADIRFPLERANGIQTFETCCALAQRGHAVTLVVRRDTTRPPRDPFEFYGQPRLAMLDVVRAAVPPGPARRAAYVAFAVPYAIAERPDVLFTRDLGVAGSVLRMPRAMRPALVYESHGYAPEVARALPHLLTGAPAPSASKLARLERRERRTWQRADGYVTITASLARELTARFGSRAALAVVADGVRLPPQRTFEPRMRDAAPVVGYAGHLYPWKGVDVLLEALARLPGVQGLIVGGHPGERDLARVIALAKARGLGERVTITGLVPPDHVAGHLARADVLVLPNTPSAISERYTSPLKLFEYMAAARPMVVSDLPAIREVVRHGESAWLVPAGDPAALADGIARVLDDPRLALALAERAWHDVADYTWAKRAERLEEVLIEAIRSTNP